ncbi:sugar-binding protein [Streptomyces sp. NPDC048172]|uniref:sugar-binding protein n=1 Tax=Streptomyces sp. NPDC048172 TaxID=3365505 RepID=UPI00370FB7FD
MPRLRRRLRPFSAVALACAAVLSAGVADTVADVDADTAADTAADADTDVLFLGAHPDDEYQSLATFGQWRQRDGLRTAVATVTRGEGGGNAVGPQEGRALGLVREREERAAVARAGIGRVHYFGKPDSWYTLSAPLVARLWNHDDALSRAVRLVRATRPETVVTMEPRPFDNHGAHQEAARLAVEAFRLAGDPRAFPEQLTAEGGLDPWRPRTLLAQHWLYEGPVGPRCADPGVRGERGERRDPRSGLPVTGVWTGTWARRSPDGGRTTWAQVERDAARAYRTQGFGALDPVVRTPRERLPCEWFTVLARDGAPVRATVRPQRGLRPLYREFRDWAARQGMPWLANGAQPRYPAPPSAVLPRAAREPGTDGRAGEGEYAGAPRIRLGHWQGSGRCRAARDCAGTVRAVRYAGALHVLFDVTDDKRGAALARSDCARHWRTDAVEIALDPRGTADDTATTLKLAVLPFTSDSPHGSGPPCAARDADHRQGPARTTAPGVRVASRVSAPYRGYTVEVRIPLRVLPAPVDPDRVRANFLLYDSDTRDRTGQVRLAWSAFGSAQADPYAWGRVRLADAL